MRHEFEYKATLPSRRQLYKAFPHQECDGMAAFNNCLRLEAAAVVVGATSRGACPIYLLDQ